MEKYFKRVGGPDSSISQSSKDNEVESSNKRVCLEATTDLVADPGLRPKISSYDPNDRDRIRRAYIQKGPCQPQSHNFPQRMIGNKLRRFNPAWFSEYKTWLEYSISEDAAYCLYCYLFRSENDILSGGETFVTKGFKNWKKKEKFDEHVGGPNSAHNKLKQNYIALMNQNQSIHTLLDKQTMQMKNDYRIRLNATIDCVRFLSRQGLAFRGNDESNISNNQGNFLELLKFLAAHNKEIGDILLENAPENLKLIAPEIQKDIVYAAATLTTKNIIMELGNEVFSILVDESRDISVKEQMIVALRYVNKNGCVVERFLSIIHVPDTTAYSLKGSLEALFSSHGLSFAKLRGQGYDGASNMRGEFHGLQALIQKENSSAYFVHCFAHQLQLALVAVAKNNVQVALLFNTILRLLNTVGASCKRRDQLRENHALQIVKAIEIGELSTGKGLNQQTSMSRPGDTRWGSHYNSLISITLMFASIVDTLDIIVQDGSNCEQRAEASSLLDSIQSFDFIFSCHLMKLVLGITSELSQSLQRKEHDIINAMTLVKISTQRLQLLRDSGWDSLLANVISFCIKQNIDVPEMDKPWMAHGRPRRRTHTMTNLHYYKVEIFYMVIDSQLKELNCRFTERTTDLLLCVACLNPSQSFSSFNKERLVQMASFYKDDFSDVDMVKLDIQLETYFLDVTSDEEFSKLKGIVDLAQLLVHKKKDMIYPLVYKLIKLALVLPVATATVERAFSAMKYIKNRLRNKMGDQWLNDSLVTYIEKDMFTNVSNEEIIQLFQNMKSRRGQL